MCWRRSLCHRCFSGKAVMSKEQECVYSLFDNLWNKRCFIIVLLFLLSYFSCNKLLTYLLTIFRHSLPLKNTLQVAMSLTDNEDVFLSLPCSNVNWLTHRLLLTPKQKSVSYQMGWDSLDSHTLSKIRITPRAWHYLRVSLNCRRNKENTQGARVNHLSLTNHAIFPGGNYANKFAGYAFICSLCTKEVLSCS